jgi:hypothetical protein
MPSSLSEWRQPGRWTIFPVARFAKSHDAVSLLADRPAIERSEDFLGKTNKVRPLTWLDTSIGGIVSRKISLVFRLSLNRAKRKICSFIGYSEFVHIWIARLVTATATQVVRPSSSGRVPAPTKARQWPCSPTAASATTMTQRPTSCTFGAK